MNPVKVILTLIPFVWTIGCLPFVNTVKPIVFGLPFLAFWLCCTIPISFICLSILYRMDAGKNGDE